MYPRGVVWRIPEEGGESPRRVYLQRGKGLGDTSAWRGGQFLVTERVGGAIVGCRPMTGGGTKEVVPRAEQGAGAAIM